MKRLNNLPINYIIGVNEIMRKGDCGGGRVVSIQTAVRETFPFQKIQKESGGHNSSYSLW
jgi:hypothetical protein